MPVLIGAMAMLGLAVGSFLNVVIYRVPIRQSLSHPPSSCPNCGQRIRNRHNVPVIGWLALRGKCADCRASINPRYPLVEAATALLFVAVTLRLSRLHQLPSLAGFLYFTAIAVALTMIDLDVKRLPSSIVLPSYPIIALLLTVGALISDEPAALLRAVVGGAALYVFYYVLAISYRQGMGFGDVRLSGIVGGALGFLSYRALLVGAFSAFLLGGIVGIFVMALGRGGRKTAIPFGPFMLIGAFVAIFWSDKISDLYSNLVLPS
jgi:leader peptidase (prepilin peptidase)/N-methyltransferase